MNGFDKEHAEAQKARKAEDIVGKWIEFFVHHRQIETEIITRKLE